MNSLSLLSGICKISVIYYVLACSFTCRIASAEVTVTALPESELLLNSEGPHWIEHDQSLIYVDIIGGYFHRYYTETGRIQRLKLADQGLGSSVTLIVPVNGTTDEFIVSVGKTLAWVQWSSSDVDHVMKVPIPLHTTDGTLLDRFNDGKCDANGRLWTGTMTTLEGDGHMFRFDHDMTSDTQLDNVSISNGIAWNADSTKMFYIDSAAYSVDVFDYDLEAGQTSNRRVLFDYKTEGLTVGLPDGMCIDEQDNVWVGSWGGSQILNIDTETGALIRTIDIPSTNVTSCSWAGPDYTTMYVTSSGEGITAEELQEKPDSGKIFKVTGLGVRGAPVHNFVLDRSILG